jgi:hypothetical protein
MKINRILFSALLAFLLVSSVSAYGYNTYTYTDKDSFAYNENVNGQDRGFKISFTDTDTRYSYPNRGYSYCNGYYNWRYKGCDRYYDDRPYYQDAYQSLDHDAVLKEAFKTYQQSSRQEYQLEAKRIALEQRNRYSYGYGYSSHRYYSYGW